MNLLEERSGRYELHDLVRLLASDQGRDDDPASVRRAALDGLFDYYRKTVAAAAVAYAPQDRERIELTEKQWIVEHPGRFALEFADRDAGRDWLEAERSNLIATALYAADHGRPEYATGVSVTLMYYLGTASLFSGAEVLHLTAIRCAKTDKVRGRSYNSLGGLYWRLGRYADGRAAYQQALDYARLAGNRLGEASGLSNVALGHYRLGDYEQAIDCQRQAYGLFEAEDNLIGLTTTLAGQGWPLLRLNRPDVALELFEQGLAISRKLGTDTFEEAFALNNVAVAHEALGRLDEAWQGFEQALELSRRIAFVNCESDCLNCLGRLHRAAGRVDEAIELHEQALDLADRLGSRPFTIEVRNDYGHALTAAGRVAEAAEQHRIALEDAERIEDRYELRRAQQALADLRS